MKKSLYIGILFSICILVLVGCSKNDDVITLKEKNKKDLDYLDIQLFQVVSKLDNSDVNWEEIKVDLETAYSSYSTIVLDLYTLGANNDDILMLNQNFDRTIIAIKEKNKSNLLKYLAKMYELLPKYIDAYNSNNPELYIKYTKASVLNGYYYSEIDEWTKVNENLLEAEAYYKNIVNDLSFLENREDKINIAYITLKELQNSVNLKNKEIFLLKYKILIKELESI